jgi:hypothetical protein
MTAKHPPESTPNRGYSYVGQESVSSISGYEKGLSPGKAIRDIKVFPPVHRKFKARTKKTSGNSRHGLST